MTLTLNWLQKITQTLNILKKNPNFEGKPSFKKRCNYCRRYGYSIAEFRQNSKIIITNHKNIENQINHFTNTLKKTKIYQTKTFTVIIVQENHLVITIMSLDNTSTTDITIVEDLLIKEIHEISHKIDIVDQTVKTINVEIIIQDQTEIEATIQITTGIVQTQTPKTDINRMIAVETSHTIETETNQTTGTDNIQIRDPETIQIIDQTLIFITIDHVTILKI